MQRAVCVVLPERSQPSKTIKAPRVRILACLSALLKSCSNGCVWYRLLHVVLAKFSARKGAVFDDYSKGTRLIKLDIGGRICIQVLLAQYATFYSGSSLMMNNELRSMFGHSIFGDARFHSNLVMGEAALSTLCCCRQERSSNQRYY